ncbi:MAG: lipid-A-disaccharide synthase [Symploca sp. SIO2B6]|nr:lipid-A-disaccharide synthase [Symploca sp. SIO2B6]
MSAADIIILSNGPGEVTTWVRPLVKVLRQLLGENREQVRISVVLSLCPHSTGKEAEIVNSYSEVDRVQGAEHFFGFFLRGVTVQNWDWRKHGVVIFLGGDQFFPVVIGSRLGYRTIVYAEWEARWHRWIHRFGVMKPEIITKAPPKYRHKFTLVGDLMADLAVEGEGMGRGGDGEKGRWGEEEIKYFQPLIGLLPGSKSAKLSQGVPLALAIAEYIYSIRPQTRFVIPVAPTVELSALASFANPNQNPLIRKLGWAEAKLVMPGDQLLSQSPEYDVEVGDTEKANSNSPSQSFLKTPKGLSVELSKAFPAYDLLSQCCLCITTVGANTAELGALAVPMIVLIPTQQLEAMRAWDGLPGVLANLPVVGAGLAKLINWLILRRKRLFAWPNIWAQEEIVPELVGQLQPQEVAQVVLDYLEHPQKLEIMRSRLRSVRGEPGAAQKLAELVKEELESF